MGAVDKDVQLRYNVLSVTQRAGFTSQRLQRTKYAIDKTNEPHDWVNLLSALPPSTVSARSRLWVKKIEN
jgi:hypothetical protein